MLSLKSLFAPADPWPLKFKQHNFNAYCYNTLRCSVIYNKFQFSLSQFESSGPPPAGDYRSRWSVTNIIGDHFAKPVKVDWLSLDGSRHHAQVDLAKMFKDRLVRHNMAREDIPEGWLAAWGVEPLGVGILMEVNDRTISIYMKALIITKEPQIPGIPGSKAREDLIQVWTNTY